MRIEREVSDQLFQSTVVFLQLPEAPQLAHAKMRIRLLPGVERGVIHSELPAEVADRGVGSCKYRGADAGGIGAVVVDELTRGPA